MNDSPKMVHRSTESAFLSTELNFKAFEEMEVEEYQYLATLDLKTSEICRKALKGAWTVTPMKMDNLQSDTLKTERSNETCKHKK